MKREEELPFVLTEKEARSLISAALGAQQNWKGQKLALLQKAISDLSVRLDGWKRRNKKRKRRPVESWERRMKLEENIPLVLLQKEARSIISAAVKSQKSLKGKKLALLLQATRELNACLDDCQRRRRNRAQRKRRAARVESGQTHKKGFREPRIQTFSQIDDLCGYKVLVKARNRAQKKWRPGFCDGGGFSSRGTFAYIWMRDKKVHRLNVEEFTVKEDFTE